MIANSSAANGDTFQVSTPSDTEIRLTRLFNAPRQLVFEVMSKPEHVREWWGQLGEGYSVPVCEIDLRVGGKWKFVNRHAHGEATFFTANTVRSPRPAGSSSRRSSPTSRTPSRWRRLC